MKPVGLQTGSRQIRITCRGADLVDIDELRPLQSDLKSLTEANYRKLKASILKHGFTFPLFVWRHDGQIWTLDGHQRDRVLRRMRDEGYTVPPLPVDYIEARDRKEAAEKILLNSSQYGQMTEESLYEFTHTEGLDENWDELKEMLELPQVDVASFDAGWMRDDAPKDAEPQIGQAAEFNKKWQVKPGDLFLIGEHRLLCGDSTNGEDVQRVMGGEKAHMVFADPPYGVDYSSKNEFLNEADNGNRNETPIEGDSGTPDKIFAFWRSAWKAVKPSMEDSCSYYITGPQRTDLLLLLLLSLREEGWPLRHMLIWVKNNHVLGHCDYHYKHEGILYGWMKSRKFYGDRSEVTVWEIDKPNRSELHPTMKPVELVARAVRNSSNVGDIVLDPFLGSGTTMVACENLKRRCRGIEISPEYCAVALQRMADAFPGIAIKKLEGA